MDDTWIVVASQTTARMIACNPGQGVSERETLLCPEGRQPERSVLTGAPGRSHDRQGPARHSMEPRTPVSEQVAAGFAERIADHLEAGRKRKEYTRLVLVAAPKLLGLLRDKLGSQCLKLVVAECRKNLVTLEAREIVDALPDAVQRALRAGHP